MKKRLILFITALIILSSLFMVSCEVKEEAVTENENEIFTKTQITVTYDKFKGVKEYKDIYLDGTKDVTFEITTKEGTLHMTVVDPKGEEIFNSDVTIQIKNTIDIKEKGNYLITIEGNDHVGGYVLKWE